jgi:queuosine precursor transporter
VNEYFGPRGVRFISWLAAALVSQLIDSFAVLYIAFVLGPQHWSIGLFLAVGAVNYCYKAVMLVIYLVRRGIRAYFGHAEAEGLEVTAVTQT